MEKKDTLVLGGHEFTSRFILGSGKFSVDLIKAAVEQGAAQIVTMALRRVEAGEKDNILDFIPKDVTLLPNTSSARTAEEAVRIARLSREIGCGDFIKIEVMRDSKYLLPDNNETIKATEILAKEGFVVLPYMYPDLYAAPGPRRRRCRCHHAFSLSDRTNKRFVDEGLHPDSHRRSDLPIIVDAGIGRPSQAVKPWKWVPLLSWPTRLSQRPATCLSWQRLRRSHSCRPQCLSVRPRPHPRNGLCL